MQIIKYLDLFVGAVINTIFFIYIVKKISNMHLVQNKKVIIINVLFTSLFITIVNIINKDFYKILMNLPFVVTCFKNVFDINYKNSFLFYIVVLVYILISEIIASFFLALLPFDYSFIFNNIIGSTIGVLIIILFTLPLLKIKILNNLMNNMIFNVSENNKIINTILMLLIIGAIVYKNISNIDNWLNIVINMIVTFVFLIIFYMYYSENLKFQELSSNYNQMQPIRYN